MPTRRHTAMKTTLGELVAACYEAALVEVGDKPTARRIAAVLVAGVLAKSRGASMKPTHRS